MAKIDLGQIVGKSAYDAAVEGGYQGTEEEFNNILANIQDAGSYGLVAKLDGTLHSLNSSKDFYFSNADYSSNEYYITMGPKIDISKEDMQNLAAAMPMITSVTFSSAGNMTTVTVDNKSGEAGKSAPITIYVFKGAPFNG